MEQSPAKIQLAIASDSAREFCLQLALKNNQEYFDLSRHVLPESLQ